MSTAVWIAAFAALAATGVAIAVRARSQLWIVAGIAFALGGLGYETWYVVCLAGGLDPPADGAAADVAIWFALAGSLSILTGMVLALLALGREGRRRFLVVFAAALLVVGTYEFWTSNWAARTADAQWRCENSGHYFTDQATIQRLPPGVHCVEGTRDVFVAADAICWLALVGWSAFYAFVFSFPLLGMDWAARRRLALRPG
jgi:hypothetical protein